MEDRLTHVPCVICGERVRLEECKLNDLGEPVHESCLAERLKKEIKRGNSAVGRSQVRREQR